MQVRSLDADFSDIGPHWSTYIDFAHQMNATSTVPSYVEPYLAKVLAKVRKALAGKSATLTRDISLFVQQEMEHCRQHDAFNAMLIRAYPQIVPQLDRYAADYERFLRTRSLQFNVAYSEGFESAIGLTTPASWCNLEACWAASDPRVEALWKWHYAEEHEHREVMFNVYHALYGRGVRAHLYRVYGFLYAMMHIGGHARRIKRILMAADRARMGEAAWKARAKPARTSIGPVLRQASMQLLKILSPSYDPSKRPPPPGAEMILAQTMVTVPIAKPSSSAP